MAEITGVSWTDRTHNEWWGCSAPAGDGCTHCYAAQLDKRTGGEYFGLGTKPRITTVKNRNKPFRWNLDAGRAGTRLKVFCGSMMDFFDKNVGPAARDPLWEKIKATPNLDWQILTKRPGNVAGMLPPDWGSGYANVWMGVTVENRRSGLRRLDQLRQIPAKVRFLSIEPLLEDLGQINLAGIDWVIIGGESGPGFRGMNAEWVHNIIRQCREQDVPVFFKQWGGTARDAGGCILAGEELKEWPRNALARQLTM